jgi:hypothetical protein
MASYKKNHQNRRDHQHVQSPRRRLRQPSASNGKAAECAYYAAKGVGELIERRRPSAPTVWLRLGDVERQKHRKESEPKALHEATGKRERKEQLRHTEERRRKKRDPSGETHGANAPQPICEKSTCDRRRNHSAHRGRDESGFRCITRRKKRKRCGNKPRHHA